MAVRTVFVSSRYTETVRCLLLVLLSLVIASCGAPSAAPDAAADAWPRPPLRQLRFDPGEGVRLEPGQVYPLELRLTDEWGGAVVGEEIRLALVNNARDASLSATRVRTDATGRARASLRASSEAATFQVRASAAYASEAYLFVSVSPRGFGGLVVPVRYVGARAPERIEVQLFEGVSCAAVGRHDPVRSVWVSPRGATVTFSGLGAGLTFTVHAQAMGRAGQAVARGCLEGLVVVRDRNLEVPLSVADLPLQLDGAYTLDLALDLGGLPLEISRQWMGAVRGEIGTHGDEAGYLFAAIANAVRLRSDEVTWRRFESMADRLRAELRTDLSRRGASPTQALEQLAQSAAVVVQSVDGTLGLLAGEEDGRAVLVVRSIAYVLDPLTPGVPDDDLRLDVAPTGVGEASVHPGDRVGVVLREVGMPLVSLARYAVSALLYRLAVASSSEWLRITVQCREVARLFQESTGGCDNQCVVNACNDAVDRLARAFDAAVGSAGATHGTVTLRFEGTARGIPGTLRVGSVEPAPLSGAFDDDASHGIVGVARLQSQ